MKYILEQKGLKPRVIFTSSREVYGNTSLPCNEDSPLKPCNAYGHSKTIGEKILRQAFENTKIPVTILRLSNIFGCRQDQPNRFFPKLYQAAFHQKTMELFGGTQKLDFLHVKDFIKALESVLDPTRSKQSFEIFNIASGTSLSLLEIIEHVEQEIGSIPVIKSSANSIEVESFFADISKAQIELDFKPRYTIHESVTDFGFAP